MPPTYPLMDSELACVFLSKEIKIKLNKKNSLIAKTFDFYNGNRRNRRNWIKIKIRYLFNKILNKILKFKVQRATLL